MSDTIRTVSIVDDGSPEMAAKIARLREQGAHVTVWPDEQAKKDHDMKSHERSYHGPCLVLSLDEGRHAMACLPDDDTSEAAVAIRSKVRAAIQSPPAFREPSP